MKRAIILAAALMLAMPAIVNAAGMGIYVPVSVGDSGSYTQNYDNDLIPDQEIDIDYKPSAGVGIAFDTNLGRDRVFNYRLGLEYMKREIDAEDGVSCSGDCDFGARLNMVHTFGFALLKTETVRLWMGPRINIAYEWDSGDNGYVRENFELGVAPALGINVNLGRLVTLGADLDYRVAGTAGAWDSDIALDGGSFSGSTQGATARFYLLFRFNEKFRPEQTATGGVIDNSL